MMPETTTNEPVLTCENNAAWATWLAKNHLASTGIWLCLAKKTAGTPSISYAEAIELALCYGWIDSQKKAHSEHFWLQRFTPRSAKSIWSKINREKVTRLIESGQMKAAGMKEIERAKNDGRWDAAYDSVRTSVIPADFQGLLDRNPKAKIFFASLDSRNRYAILFRIQTAKKVETRESRIRKFVEMLGNHEKLYP